MCLAEALLRIPDAAHRRRIDRRQVGRPRLGRKARRQSDSAFVNAATFSLLLTGKVLEGANDRADNWRAALGRAVGRLGEPVIRTAVGQAMRILGRQFVFGRTIDEALKRATPERKQGPQPQLRHARRSGADPSPTPTRYAHAYRDALDRIAREAGERRSPVARAFRSS